MTTLLEARDVTKVFGGGLLDRNTTVALEDFSLAIDSERPSITYITHDLATAYQISENIVVLYRGSVAEAGDVELVVKHPQHPYTQLLISSIPVVSAERTWTTAAAADPAIQTAGHAGCKFADRCPSATPPCLRTPPPLFRTAPHRAVACYLYQGTPVLPGEELGTAFVAPAPPPHTVVGPNGLR
jgi:oligopeptide/dipeptide ABC transporter ATP-binding protein